jgi:hypothetical protein
MWTYGTAQCVHKDLLHSAAKRAAHLATQQAFSSSRQAAVLLRAFKDLGLGLWHESNRLLMQEVDRLRALEGQQQQQQQQQGQQPQGQQQQQQQQVVSLYREQVRS